MPDSADDTAAHLRGASQLTVDAVVGVVDIVEAMHRTISTLGGLFAGGQRERTTGLTGFVYSNIRAVTTLVGGGLDAALGVLAARLAEVDPQTGAERWAGREAVVAAVNGVLGDYLVASANPLAIPMELRQGGVAVSADDPALHAAVEAADGRVLLLVHGSSSSDLQWARKGHDHGAALADDLGLVPLYLRYNSGRHISHNGADLADLLEAFLAGLPEVRELVIVAHSMGGLVSRSACYYAEAKGHRWRDRLARLVCLATPHHGALLERSGNWVDNILQVSPYSTPLARLGKIRSAGVTDLRWGNIVDEDWQGSERFALSADARQPVALPDGVDCYTLAVTLGASAHRLGDHVVGDGLVQLDSALGRHDDPRYDLGFAPDHQRIVRGVSHLDVLCDPRVYETLRDWLAA